MKKMMLLAAFAAMAMGVAACDGGGKGDDDDDDDGSSYDLTIGSTNWPHADGGVRLLYGTTVVFSTCGTLGVTGQAWSVTRPGIITSSGAYSIEVWGDLGGNPNAYNSGSDHSYVFGRNAGENTDANIIFDHNATAQTVPPDFTWANNASCPGT